MIPLILALWLACGGADPELKSQRAALDVWRDGKQLLESGRPAEAEAAFARALELRPDDPVLSAWLAHAKAESGELDEAIAILDAVIARTPEFAEARYNRAAYLAREGDLEGAAADLARALNDGARPPREVLSDPDFQPHLDHPAFGFLPRDGLLVAIDGPEGPAFQGSRVEIRLQVLGVADDDGVQVIEGAASGPVRLLSVVEDELQSTEGPGRELTYTFEVLGPGHVDVGPLTLGSGPHRATTEVFGFEGIAAPGREAPKLPPVSLETASQVAASLELPSIRWADGRLLVKIAPGDRIVVEPDPGPPDTWWELRDGRRPLWVAHQWALAAAPARIQVLRGGQAVLDERPAAASRPGEAPAPTSAGSSG